MPTYPQTGLNFGNFLTHSGADADGLGLIHSQSLSGGYQEVKTVAERNLIPVQADAAGVIYNGFTAAGDGGWTSGRRKVGMMVYCLDVDKLYILKPVGYFGNGGNSDETAWLALPEAERAVRIFPTGTFTSGLSAPPPPITSTYTDAASIGITADANSCWVELELGGDNIYSSNLAGTLSMTEDVGGMPSGTLVSDLTEIKTYDQLFDTILFPTSYPTASGPSVGLSGASGLKIIGSTFAGTLTTTANQGSITLNGVNQGVRSGDVTAANIAGPGGPYTLGVTAPNGIDDQAIAGHTVTEGSNSWTLTATFAQGPMPLDSTGADYPSVRYNGGDKTNSASFEGVYPIFLGNVGGNFDQASLISHGANYPNIQTDQAYAEVNGSLHHRISIPDDMIDGRTIEVWQYSTVSTQYAEATAAWVVSSETRTIESNTVNYTLLSKTGSAGGSNLYRIKFV
jgi:hypothetical protein